MIPKLHSAGGGGLWPPAQTPLRSQRIPPGYTCSAGVVGQPQAPGAACHRWVSLARWGGGWRSAWGAWRGGGLLCLGPSLCLAWAGNKAGVIGNAQVMEGVAPILLRFVFACRPPAWSAGAGGGGCGGACRASSAAPPPPGRRGPFGGGGRSLCLGGGRRPAPLWPAGRRGESGGEGRGGRAVVPHLSALGGWPVAPGPVPLLLRRIPPGYTCSVGVAGHPWVPGAAWLAVCRSAWREGRAASAPYPRGLVRGAPRGGEQGGPFAPPSLGGHQGESLRLCPALHAAFPDVAFPLQPTGCP